MAKESEKPTSAEKGKGKAVEAPKDDKPVANGKNDDKDKKDGSLPCPLRAIRSD